MVLYHFVAMPSQLGKRKRIYQSLVSIWAGLQRTFHVLQVITNMFTRVRLLVLPSSPRSST